MFWESKCRGRSDLGLCTTCGLANTTYGLALCTTYGLALCTTYLCTTYGLAKRMPLRSANFWPTLRPNLFCNWKSAPRSLILFASSKVIHRPRSDFLLYCGIENIQQICTENHQAGAWRLLPATMPERWPFFACRSRFDYYRPIGLFLQERIRWNAD